MASIIPNFSKDNLSLYAIPAAWVVAIVPRFYAIVAYKQSTKKDLDGKAPRDWPLQLANNQALDAKAKGRIMRAESAQSNGLENIGLFAAAVVAGNVAGLPANTLNTLSFSYVASRIVYNYIYINNDDIPVAARTATFFAGLGCVFTLFIKAGNGLKNAVILG